jgi:hypothetical protein
MIKQEPITTIAEILETSESWVWEYEIEINWEIIQLHLESLKIIKKELKNAIFKKDIEKAIIKWLKK